MIICLILTTILIGASISTPINARDLEIPEILNNETLTIETNLYNSRVPKKLLTECTESEILEIIDTLENLNQAIEESNEEEIQNCQEILKEKGLFGKYKYDFFSNEEFTETYDTYSQGRFSNYQENTLNGDLDNMFCYFNAIGEGIMVSQLGIKAFEAFQRIVSNASGFLEAFILTLIFLPFVLVIMVLTGLIPFRILMPEGLVYMEDGRLSTLGINGFKRVTVEDGDPPVSVNLSFFTGLSISIPGNADTGRKAFTFVSGPAIRVYDSDI